MLVASFAGCGGSTESSSSDSSATATSSSVECKSDLCLRWNPPTSYDDGSALSAGNELSEYVVYISSTGTFTEENEMAVVPAVNTNGTLSTSFDLENLAGELKQGITYYVSMQAVTTSGVRSELSPSARFSL